MGRRAIEVADLVGGRKLVGEAKCLKGGVQEPLGVHRSHRAVHDDGARYSEGVEEAHVLGRRHTCILENSTQKLYRRGQRTGEQAMAFGCLRGGKSTLYNGWTDCCAI